MKKIITILVSLSLLICLSACGSNDGKETPDTDAKRPNTPQKTNQTQASNGSEYWGVYETDDGFLEIYDDGTFDISDFNGNLYDYGTCNFENGLILIFEEGERVFFVLDEYGNLYGGEAMGTLLRIDKNDLPINDHGDLFKELDFEGYWKDEKYGDILEIVYGEWHLYDDIGRLIQYGPVEIEGAQAWLMNQDGSSGGGYLYFDDDGNLIQSGEILTRLDEFPYVNSENEIFSDVLAGTWYHTDMYGSYESPTIYFDGYDRFSWDWDNESHTGTYILDGDEILCRYDDDDIDVYWSMTFQNGQISVEGDGGSWYSKD